MGFVGREEGIVAYATVLLESMYNPVPGITASSYICSMSKIKVRIINQSTNPLPEYVTEGAAGMDLRANLEQPRYPCSPWNGMLIPTGLFIELPSGYEAQIRPRSGLAIKHGLTCLNSPGTIDADYRGEIKVILINLSQ